MQALSASHSESRSKQRTQHRVAIIGGSLGGLAAANAFVQLGGWDVCVFERSNTTFEAKGHGLGYVDVDLWQQLRGVRMMRRGRQASREQGAFYYGDLWNFLCAGLPEGTLRLGQGVEDLGADVEHPTIAGEVFDLCIVADGGWSGLRHYVTSTQPEYAGYVVWRGRVEASEVPGFQSFGVFKSGILDTIAMPLSPDDGRNFIVSGMFLATPEAEVRKPQVGSSRHGVSDAEKEKEQDANVPAYFLPLYRQKFGAQRGGELLRLVEATISKGKFTPHAQFEYGADRVVAGRVVLIGDAAHMASPRTAVGAHTAVLDAVGLRDAFRAAKGDINGALELYSRDGVERAQALLKRSREVSCEFLPFGGVPAIVSPSALLQT